MIKNRQLKSAFVQLSVEECEAIIFPTKYFDMRPGPVDENKYVAIFYPFSQFIDNNTAQRVEALAQ